MKLKTVEINGKKYAEIQDDKPLYIDNDGKELAFDAPQTRATITRLNGEAQAHREKFEAAETKLKSFEGITDPAAALKAIETVKNLDDKKLVDAGQVETVKREVSKSFEDKIAAMTTSHAQALTAARDETTKITNLYNTEKVSAGFSGSKLISEKFLIPADMAQARFGNNFKVEDGKLVAYDNAGNKIYSRARPAELANFDEALETLVDQYPYKDHILKGKGGGSGADRGNGGKAGDKTIPRAEYEKNPGAYAQKFRDGYTLAD